MRILVRATTAAASSHIPRVRFPVSPRPISSSPLYPVPVRRRHYCTVCNVCTVSNPPEVFPLRVSLPTVAFFSRLL